MAVETPHINLLFSSQLLINNREMIKGNNNNNNNHEMDGASLPLLSSTMPESFLPFQQFCDPNSTNKQAESGLTYHHHHHIPVPRKRARDTIAEDALPLPQKHRLSSQSPFLDQHLLYHFQSQQSEIDRFISQHREKVRMELEEQRMRQSRVVVSTIQEAVVKKLKEKEQEIQRMGKLNLVLQEKVKSLCVENQIWREMAQSNEAAANSLRTNLEQVLAHVNNDNGMDDAESSCSSNNNDDDAVTVVGRMCNECGVRESAVLLLPCRHLCLCTVCGSTIRNCPLCHSTINASVCVNFS